MIGRVWRRVAACVVAGLYGVAASSVGLAQRSDSPRRELTPAERAASVNAEWMSVLTYGSRWRAGSHFSGVSLAGEYLISVLPPVSFFVRAIAFNERPEIMMEYALGKNRQTCGIGCLEVLDLANLSSQPDPYSAFVFCWYRVPWYLLSIEVGQLETRGSARARQTINKCGARARQAVYDLTAPLAYRRYPPALIGNAPLTDDRARTLVGRYEMCGALLGVLEYIQTDSGDIRFSSYGSPSAIVACANDPAIVRGLAP